MCIHDFVCACLFVPTDCMKINGESKIYSPLPSFILLKNTPQIAKCSSSLKEVVPLEDNMCVYACVWCTVYVCVKQSCVLCEQVARSRVDAKGQQFV